MSRALTLLILIILLVAGAALFLSSRADQVPTRIIEVDVAPAANAQ